jgi:hypothetical protein
VQVIDEWGDVIANVMQFAPTECPGSVVGGHWSMTLVTAPEHRVVPNPSIGSSSTAIPRSCASGTGR